MELSDTLNIIALVIVPILAVVVGQGLQHSAEKRRDKMHVFKTLMTSRIYGLTREGVEAQNIIDVVFVDDKKVREAWKDLNDKYHVSNPDEQHLEKVRQAQFKLLEEMARSLGYKDKITWETIQNPYVPNGLIEQMSNQTAYNQGMLAALAHINGYMDRNQADSDGQNGKSDL